MVKIQRAAGFYGDPVGHVKSGGIRLHLKQVGAACCFDVGVKKILRGRTMIDDPQVGARAIGSVSWNRNGRMLNFQRTGIVAVCRHHR